MPNRDTQYLFDLFCARRKSRCSACQAGGLGVDGVGHDASRRPAFDRGYRHNQGLLLLGLSQAKTPPITLQYGDDVIVLVKAQMRVTATPHTMLIDMNRCEEELAMAFSQVAWLFFEPEPEDSIAPLPSTQSTA